MTCGLDFKTPKESVAAETHGNSASISHQLAAGRVRPLADFRSAHPSSRRFGKSARLSQVNYDRGINRGSKPWRLKS